MNKVLAIVAAVLVIGGIVTTTTSCQSDNLPTYEQAFKSSGAFGTVAGVIVKYTVKDTNSVKMACAIMEEVRSDIPNTNETFVTCWMPKIESRLDDLKTKEKIDDAQYARIYKTSKIGCTCLDMFVSNHQIVRQYDDLFYAVVDGFVSGFEGSLKFKRNSSDKNVNENDVKTLAAACAVPYVPAEQRE